MTSKHFFTPKSVFQLLTSIILILLIANISGIFLWSRDPEDSLTINVIRLFDLNQVFNIPTVLMSGLLLMTTVFLYKTGNRQSETAAPWYGLGFFFLFLTGSKAFQIQNILLWMMRKYLLPISNPWIIFSIVGLISVILLVKIYWPFLSRLPNATIMLMALGMSIFIFGAFVVDWMGGIHREINGVELTYKIYYTIEETLEMMGISMFIYALMKYRAKK